TPGRAPIPRAARRAARPGSPRTVLLDRLTAFAITRRRRSLSPRSLPTRPTRLRVRRNSFNSTWIALPAPRRNRRSRWEAGVRQGVVDGHEGGGGFEEMGGGLLGVLLEVQQPGQPEVRERHHQPLRAREDRGRVVLDAVLPPEDRRLTDPPWDVCVKRPAVR